MRRFIAAIYCIAWHICKKYFLKWFFFHFNDLLFKIYKPPWTQDVNWTYIRRSEDIQDVLWLSYVRSIYLLCPGGVFCFGECFLSFTIKLVYSGQTVALLLTPHISHTAPVPLITYPVVPYTQKKNFFSKQKQKTLNCSPQKQSPRGVL